MAHYYIAPLHITADQRGGTVYRTAPLFYHSRLNPSGVLAGGWAIKDFGKDVNHCLLATLNPIPPQHLTSDFLSFDGDLFQTADASEKETLGGFLKDAGVEDAWVKDGLSRREVIHRLCGMTLAMQEQKDAPDKWLIEPIEFSVGQLIPFNARGYEQAQLLKRD